MTDRLKKEDFVRLLATRMNADEATATAWVDGVVETLYESFKDGKSVTLPGFGLPSTIFWALTFPTLFRSGTTMLTIGRPPLNPPILDIC